ncbi:tetratricopeptide repeat protein [Bacteroides sp. 3_1_13]|uniref:tetratricopeptide repeat protein n=1 Tax=Bacteroides sp. 3_1_13 TaxID=457389 RepID=UPI0006721E10|nr:hypothetical protein [Bacteroides sp. 3_1_13]KMW80010.1 hypothetical protein HMPREF9009_00732 [Bacteroides sp. 3_1_13]
MYYNLLLVKAQDKCYHRHLSDSTIQTVVRYYESRNESDRLMETYYYWGRAYMDMHETPRALETFQKAMEVFCNTQKYDILGLIYSQTATLYVYQDIYEEALPMYRNALKYFYLADDTLAIPHALRDIGRMFKVIENEDSTFFYYKKSYQYANQIGDLRRKNSITGELATLYIQSNQYDKATKLLYMLSTYDISQRNLAQYYNNWGDYYQKNEMVDSAAYCYLKSISYDNLYAKPHSYWKIYELEARLHNYPQMITYINRY